MFFVKLLLFKLEVNVLIKNGVRGFVSEDQALDPARLRKLIYPSGLSVQRLHVLRSYSSRRKLGIAQQGRAEGRSTQEDHGVEVATIRRCEFAYANADEFPIKDIHPVGGTLHQSGHRALGRFGHFVVV